MRWRSAAIALAVLLAGPGVRETEPQAARTPTTPTFEVGIDVTNLDVSVREGRNYVGDLSRNDFVVYEDGMRQDVSLFIHEWLPISLTIMLDVSASMAPHLPVAQKAATGFLSTLQTGDRAAVMTFNSRVATLVDFTGDRRVLETAIGRTEASGATMKSFPKTGVLETITDIDSTSILLSSSKVRNTFGLVSCWMKVNAAALRLDNLPSATLAPSG